MEPAAEDDEHDLRAVLGWLEETAAGEERACTDLVLEKNFSSALDAARLAVKLRTYATELRSQLDDLRKTPPAVAAAEGE